MPGEDIQSWSVTAINNANSDTAINWAEGQPRASVNNSSRSQMAAHAKDRNLKNGSIVTGGSANAQTFTSGVGYIAPIPTGLRVTLKIGPGLTNTGPATLDMDGIGSVAIKDPLGADVGFGALKADTYAEFIYNDTNWLLLMNFAAAAIEGLTNLRVFTGNDTYPVTTAACKVLVYCKGGGGGGGSSTIPFRGGGGGEGAETWTLLTAAALSAASVVVGAGGNGGAAGTAGLDGAITSVGVIAGAGGGTGGNPGQFGGGGGAGGAIGATNNYGMPGAAGQPGADETATIAGMLSAGGGKGGGGAATNGVSNSGGGGGGGSNATPAGNGGSGIVVCHEYGLI